MFTAKKLSALLCAAALTACGTYEKDAYFQDIQKSVNERTSYTVKRTSDMAAAPFLTGILSYSQAVKAALRYNPSLQAYLEDMNVATATEVQAGLLINPTFQGEFVFTGGGARPLLDFMLALDVSRIVTRSRRIAIAKSERKAVQAKVTKKIVETIINTQSALLKLWHAELVLKLYSEQFLIATSGANTAQLLYDAGNITDGMLAEYYSTKDLIHVAKTRAALMVMDAREALAEATGTQISQNVSAASNLYIIPFNMEKNTFIERSLDINLDLNAERARIKALGARYGLAKISAWVEHLEVEAVYEREDSGAGGFSATLPVPIFDWGQVRTGQAQAMLDAASYRYKALYLNVSNRAAALYAYTQSLKEAEKRMSGAFLKNADKAYLFQESQLNAMQIGPLGLLNARSSLIGKQMQALDIQYQFGMATLKANALLTGIITRSQNFEMSAEMIVKDDGGH